MNILYGLYKPTKGEIYINSQKVDIHGPTDAIRQGIGMVHQHFMLVPVLTVTENVMLGEESIHRGLFLNRNAVANRIREISKKYGLQVDPDAYVKDLPVGIQQRVEIIKVLYRNANVLILDEPTAGMNPEELVQMMDIIRKVHGEFGLAIFLIEHRMRVVMELCQRIQTLVFGEVIAEGTPEEIQKNPKVIDAYLCEEIVE